MRTFTVFIGFALIHSTPQSIEPPEFSAHARLLLPQAQAVGDHGDELRVRRLALDVRDRVAEKLLQRLDMIYCFVHRYNSDEFIGFVLMISTIKKCVKRHAYKL